MKTRRMTPSTRTALIVALSALGGVILCAGAFGVYLTSNPGKQVAGKNPVATASATIYSLPPATRSSPLPERTIEPTKTTAPPTTANVLPPAVSAPEVIQTAHAPLVAPPARTATAEKPCPAGSVSVGLSDVSFTDTRPWVTGTLQTVTGRGSYYNGTNAPVLVWAGSVPTVAGLNLNGESVYVSGLGEIDYVPPAGQPRPSRLSLAPGESLSYSFTDKDTSSTALAEIKYWYTATDPVWVDYADFDLHVRCGAVDVIPPSKGASIPNTFR